jgi:hypothetical protein
MQVPLDEVDFLEKGLSRISDVLLIDNKFGRLRSIATRPEEPSRNPANHQSPMA